MKTIILFILLAITINAQSELLLLMNNEGLSPYPVTADLVASYDENEMAISSWVDQTGTLDFAQSTAGNQPTLTASAINGYPGLLFDGVDNFMVTPSLTLNQAFTFYIVFKNVIWTNGVTLLTAGDFVPAINLGGGENHIYTTTDGINYLIGTSNTGDYQILSIVYNGASSVIQTNESIVENNPGVVGIADQFLTICALGNGNSAGNFELAAMYIHSTAHDLATRTQIINWLNTKYGVF